MRLAELLVGHLQSPILKFYTASDPWNELDLNLPVSKLSPELHIRQADVGISLLEWPDTGKFLQAMRQNTFDPQNASFEIEWTADSAQQVPARDALRLVKDILHRWPTHTESECQFVQVFGKLTTSIELWNGFNLKLLQSFLPGTQTFKHAVCQHWLELARYVATSMVSTDLRTLPSCLMYHGTGCCIVGHDWPSPLNEDIDLLHALRGDQMAVSFEWRHVAKCLLFLDWNLEQEGLRSFREQVYKVEGHRPPDDFQTLPPDEILQMVHVQLRLSCCRVAEIEGPINEATAISNLLLFIDL
eukprot:Skav234761  [mRNA]  locus=scaffold4095:23966:24868:- [translate_table: standard]